MAGIKLICTIPLHGYDKGQEVTDPAEIAKLCGGDKDNPTDDKSHHFVKVALAPAQSLTLPEAPALKA